MSNDIDRRFTEHLKNYSYCGRKLNAWITRMKESGMIDSVRSITLQDNISKSDVLSIERYYIEKFNAESPLLNGNKTGVKKEPQNKDKKKKLIHLDETISAKLSHKAIDEGKSLKKFIEDKLTEIACK